MNYLSRIPTFLRPGILLLAFAGVWASMQPALAQTVPVEVRISSDGNSPSLTIINKGRLRIAKFEMTIGLLSKNFDGRGTYVSSTSSGVTATLNSPQPDEQADVLSVDFIDLLPDKQAVIRLDFDSDGLNDGQDYHNILFNNGNSPNAVITVTDIDGNEDSITLPNSSSTGSRTYRIDPERFTLEVASLLENNLDAVNKVTVTVGGNTVLTEGSDASNFSTQVEDGQEVVVAVPQAVYKDGNSQDITDTVENDAAKILTDAEERLTAIGITVNDTPQTGDPTLYRFTMTGPTQLQIKWKQEFSLRIRNDFAQTQSIETDETGAPWAGPLISQASGNPSPEAKKHWILSGETVISQIDGQVLDFSRPGLDIRYVPKRADITGAAAPGAGPTGSAVVFGDLEAPRQQIPEFTMNGPASVSYIWQIQYGVKMNVDDASRSALPKVFRRNPDTTLTEVGNLEGTFWFDPGSHLVVATAANETRDTSSQALVGWISGDGYYFSSNGTVSTEDGELVSGGPTTVNGNPVGQWVAEVTDQSGRIYRGMEIPQFRRPARVLWTYGGQVISVTVPIGEYVFETDGHSQYGSLFKTEPLAIQQLDVTGRNSNPPNGMTIWDSEASRLYPIVPGTFRATWLPTPTAEQPFEVIVTSVYPTEAHYPHIASTPSVSLDPDPNDDVVFKQVLYTENDASADGNAQFIADEPGRSVLLFGEFHDDGRGPPREFLRIRVVETKVWNDASIYSSNGSAIIGRKITDAARDLANLGTGYIFFPDARYNPFIYDATALENLSVTQVYDLDLLRSSTGEKVVVNKDSLPGPIIPVNLHPGAAAEERLVVVWYDDPAENDDMLWPHRVRTYLPRWPVNASEGLGRIVIASQYGSESVDASGQDQEVVPAIGNVARATTYDPARLQQVQVYVQNDPSSAGYNPNEEHAVLAPSLRFAQVSPRPPAAYALRHNDLNLYNAGSSTAQNQPGDYTSHPYVLVQFKDTADSEFKMRVYRVQKEDPNFENYSFARASLVTPGSSGVVSTSARSLLAEPHVTMVAGEPVIPFYPLGPVTGAVPCPETFGRNIKGQETYWEDHKGSYWAVSGGDNAWFTVQFYYPLQPDFWWPNAPGTIRDFDAVDVATADCVSFLPSDVKSLTDLETGDRVTTAIATDYQPVRILFKSDWPAVAPILKAGETLTYSGGEYRADHPTTLSLDANGNIITVETPGLPAVLAMASAEVVFDALNPGAASSLWKSSWTARVGQMLEGLTVDLPIGDFPAELTPATGRTTVSGGSYIFNDLPASLQKRISYNPTFGQLEVFGLVNDKEIGDTTLTASPPAVYVLEPNILTFADVVSLQSLDDQGDSAWDQAVLDLYNLSRNPGEIEDANGVIEGDYLVGLERKIDRDPDTGEPLTVALPGEDEDSVLREYKRLPTTPAPFRGLGPGLALFPNAGFLDPQGSIGGSGDPLPEISWITVAENNDPALGGSPVVLHVIKVDRNERYRGAIQTILSDNVFDENMTLRHTADFGTHTQDLFYEWWYRPDDGSLNVPPPDLVPASQTNPWKLFPDSTGGQGRGQNEILLKGNPNAPETLLADSFWFTRYRHQNDRVDGNDWNVSQLNGDEAVNFTWAGAGNSDPFNDFDFDGVPDYRAQLAFGWIKRVLDAVNPYEARIRDFSSDYPSTQASFISQLGARYEGPVALNPAKNVIENVGLIELYETILKRGRDLSIDLSRPVSTPAIANALQLASTRISDFYMLLGNEAYTDSLDPTIGFGSSSVEYGSLAPAVFAFQNQMSTLLEEELALLRGVDDFFARPVYNRLFWNFTKGEGEAAYAMNYNVADYNADGFINEDDAMGQYPQGHGDAWGHYLTALRNQYELLKHPFFNWVSRSEFYNLQDIVIKVDFLDERKFAKVAAAKAKAGAEIVEQTYRENYVGDPTAQWQGYTDSNLDRSWGVQGWARRAGQGAYFDWVTANALLPSEHPNSELEGIQRVDRQSNADIAVISANLNKVQTTFDSANDGKNPLGIQRDVVPFDIDPELLDRGSSITRTHFQQIYERAVSALQNAVAIWDNANQPRNMLRRISNAETDLRNSAWEEDLSYKNRLIAIFGRPYDGTIGSGNVYPPGYDGPDVSLYMYVNVREITQDTVPGPSTSFASFDSTGKLTGGDLNSAWNGDGGSSISGYPNSTRHLYAPTFELDTNTQDFFFFSVDVPIDGTASFQAKDGLYGVNYTDLTDPKVALDNLTQLLPVKASGYTFQAPDVWGQRLATGELQTLISQMIQQEASIASAIGAWDGLTGEIIRTFRLINAQNEINSRIRQRNEDLLLAKNIVKTVLDGISLGIEISELVEETVKVTIDGAEGAVPNNLPTGGLAVSPGDALAPLRGGLVISKVAVGTSFDVAQAVLKGIAFAQETAFAWSEFGVELANNADEADLAQRERAKELEDLIGDEPIKRIEIFKEIEALREMSARYVTLLDEGNRLIDERIAFNTGVAGDTQLLRYQDLTFRTARNHALTQYRAMFDLAARYTYMAAKAYEYELNLDPDHPGSASGILQDIVRARTIGNVSGGVPRPGGGLADALARLKINFDGLSTQMGFNNPQTETGKMSLRTENYRIFPKGKTQPPGFREPGADSDDLWRQTLSDAVVEDLWSIPEFRLQCRPFAAAVDTDGNPVPQPGIVLHFDSQIIAGKNYFGNPLGGGDHSYDPSNFSTKIRSLGVWFSDYQSEDLELDLPEAPRIYLVPSGLDVMAVPTSEDPQHVRFWRVVDQKLPVPIPAVESELDYINWMPLLDSLNGNLGESRKFSSFRAYHNGSEAINLDELIFDSRLVGRSVWNTGWTLIIPGITLNADPDEGISRFIQQVSDIKLVFQTYGISGN